MKLSLIVDIVAVAMILFFAFGGKKKGLVMMLAGAVGTLVSFFGSALIAQRLSPWVAERLLKPLILGWVEKSGAAVIEAQAAASAQGGAGLAQGAIDAAREMVEALGLSKLFSGEIAQSISDLVTQAGKNIADATATIVAHNLAYILVFIVSLIVLSILVFLAARLVNVAFKLPVLSGINRLGGLLAGALWGALIVAVLIWILVAFFPSTTAAGGILAPEVVQNSYVVRFFASFYPGAMLSANL